MAVVEKNLTQFKAIIKMNANKTPISLNKYFNKLLLEKDSRGNFKTIEKEMLAARPWFTGTAFAVEKIGKPLSKPIEKEFNYKGQKKTAVFNRKGEHLANADEMLICEPKQFGETEYIKLINLKTDKQILTLDALGEAGEIELIFNGQNRNFKIQSRSGGVFEAVGDEKTYTWVSDGSVFGLFRRGDYYFFFGNDVRYGVSAYDDLDYRFGVRFELAVSKEDFEAAVKVLEKAGVEQNLIYQIRSSAELC
ncbi:hypothetical protein COU37_02835 [Candidatus Micrarchaeota archaeon CG10_big_fil_rev_8_21_14_0_10_45_29]|nr:MAG: hypothetical protein COU37_02835 [Candidatus Micrarchaeota archaeon CG10_big_fil_rev_8_21_14_0_10_45_29]